MGNFKVIYQILSLLEQSLDVGYVDRDLMKADTFDVSENRFCALLKMLQDDGYISGIVFFPGKTGFKLVDPRITLRGLEYLEDNSTIRKAAKFLKEVRNSSGFMNMQK